MCVENIKELCPTTVLSMVEVQTRESPSFLLKCRERERERREEIIK
jgi:hypothetical protein